MRPRLRRLSASADATHSPQDHKLGDRNEATTLTTPRAQNDVAITVRGEPKHRQKLLFQKGPDVLGSTRFKFAWRPGGSMIATASSKGNQLVLHLFRRDGSIYNQSVLGGSGKCLWLEWECKGQSLGLLQEGSGIYLWDMPAEGSEEVTVPMSLCPSITQHSSFCRWSKTASLLAIGTQQGKVRRPPPAARAGTGSREGGGAQGGASADVSCSRVSTQWVGGRSFGAAARQDSCQLCWPWPSLALTMLASARAAHPDSQVIIFNKAEGVMQLHEKKGKHGAPVTCGDWLFDNRLGLASGLRVQRGILNACRLACALQDIADVLCAG